MTLPIKPLTARFGAEITGIDLARLPADAERRHLYRLFTEHAVLVFRDQRFDPPQFAAARIFGEIIPEQFANFRLPEYPTISFPLSLPRAAGRRGSDRRRAGTCLTPATPDRGCVGEAPPHMLGRQ
jgi:alpha-ketoglutarate-dependent taurine dioxygenase